MTPAAQNKHVPAIDPLMLLAYKDNWIRESTGNQHGNNRGVYSNEDADHFREQRHDTGTVFRRESLCRTEL